MIFADTRDRPMKDSALLPGLGADLDDWLDTQFFELAIDAGHCKAKYGAGERMDWHLAVAALF